MRNYLEGTDTQKQRAYSPAVVTQGGRTVWLAGHTATQDAEGRDISYNFEAQVHQVSRDLDNTLRRAMTLGSGVKVAEFGSLKPVPNRRW